MMLTTPASSFFFLSFFFLCREDCFSHESFLLVHVHAHAHTAVEFDYIDSYLYYLIFHFIIAPLPFHV